jgi:transglutaminase-like putative cysteine protease
MFAMGRPRSFQGTVRVLERDSSGGFYAAGQRDERIRYTVGSRTPEFPEDALRLDRAVPEPRQRGRNLQLPPMMLDVAGLAESIVADATNDADRVRAIERYLVINGKYTDEPPPPDPESDLTPIELFLQGGMAGHCEYFASSMVVLARALGIPARLVNGFAGGHANRFGGFLEVARADAHSWVEVHYEKAGWVRYDPTPPDLRARAEVALTFSEQMQELASAIELYWYQRVIGFDRSDQIHAVKSAWLAWREARDPRKAAGAPRSKRGWGGIDYARLRPWILPVLGAMAVGFGMARMRWRRGHAAGVPRVYREALRLLARRGLEREPQVTARAFARRVREETSENVSRAFDALTESYLSERFGGRRSPTAPDQLAALRNALKPR